MKEGFSASEKVQVRVNNILRGTLSTHVSNKFFRLTFILEFMDEVGRTYHPKILSFVEVTSTVFIVMGLPFSRRNISKTNHEN